jgi:hypothetical protein
VIDKNEQIQISDSTSVLREEFPDSKKKSTDYNEDEEEVVEKEKSSSSTSLFNDQSFNKYDKLFDS